MMFKDELDNRLLYINSVIKEFLPESDNELYKKIIDAACYSVEAGGKRIRPMIMLETYRLCGGKDEEIVKPFMAALEYIHTYSLVHDDLPAMITDVEGLQLIRYLVKILEFLQVMHFLIMHMR